MASNLPFTTILLFISYSSLHPSYAGQIFKEFIFPNFTASSLQFIDNTGAFLASPNGIFSLSIYNMGLQEFSFYLCVIHVASNTIIWSANGNSPISRSGMMYLTAGGISITNANGKLSWTTPPLKAAVMALQLLDSGNLVLLDKSNMSLWQSFDHPTDTILISQSLSKGKMLTSALSDSNLTTGDYQFSVTSDGAVLQWGIQEYWKLSMDPRAVKLYNGEVSYIQMNQSGIYLFSGNGTVVIWAVSLSMSNIQIAMAKLDYKGRFSIISFSDSGSRVEFTAPVEDCHLPIPCGRLGLCRLNTSGCSCPSGFHVSNTLDNACLPYRNNESLPSTCNSNASFTYLGLGGGFRYFTNNFVRPTSFGGDFFTCQDLCTRNCSCLGFFYMNSSAFCYLLKNPLGSFFATADKSYKDSLGYIKMVSLTRNADDIVHNSKRDFPMFVLILIPGIGIFLSIILLVKCALWQKGSRISKAAVIKLGSRSSSISELFDTFPIPGLPARFTYEELEEATNHFNTPIGSGSCTFYFPLFALEMHQQGRYLDLVDQRLDGRVTSVEVERLVRIALCCLHLQPMLRPSMANVVAMLEGRMGLCTPRVDSLKFLFYGRRMRESEMVDGYGDDASLRQLAAFSLTSSTSSIHP
ncbi:hypothetical protein MRB53_033726 [Persea americana]|uniref:Uncharacterized protein n=1 Tax=Persea americana TaxID=3435 RepID=A0ACC2KVB0_PERAE|nr:hypothetical protein MRB53_033726 [Persea americana]